MSEWQPMDTAPRDGARILYWNKYSGVGHCRWYEAIDDDGYACWWDDEKDDEACPKWWMAALPDPPAVQTAPPEYP
jgi:hypothetical protein